MKLSILAAAFLSELVSAEGYKSVGYFASWVVHHRHHTVNDLPASHLTHVMYSFANVMPESGEVVLVDPWGDFGNGGKDTLGGGSLGKLYAFKQQNRHVKTLLSIGGWNFSKNFRPVVVDAEKRAGFVRSAVKLMLDLGMDGLDIDFEYPDTREETQGFLELLREVRLALDNLERVDGYHYLLAIATAAAEDRYSKLPLQEMDKVLDLWNLMAYDFEGSWSDPAVAGHHSNLNRIPGKKHSVKLAVDGYLAAGVTPSKLVLGIPLYGRSFDNTRGPGTSFNGVGVPDLQKSWEAGAWDYKALPLPGSEFHRDVEAGASWCYNPATNFMVSYNSPEDAREKAVYIAEKKLGGAFYWETNGDLPITHADSLIANTVNTLGGVQALEKSTNQIRFPKSKFDDVLK